MPTTATLANPLPNTLVVPPHAPITETAAIELRAIKSSAARNDVWVGYFNDPAILAGHAKRLNEEGYHIYSPINPILQIDAVVAKLNQPPARGGATGNAGIARRLVVPYDIDAIRGIDEKATAAARAAAETRAAEAQAAAAVAPPEEATKAAQVVAAAEKAIAKLASDPIRHGAATNEERDAARSMTQSIVNFWREHGVGPKVLDSGNGFQIFVPIDLPNDSDSEKLVRDVLAVHAVEFETPGVKLDCWSDAARILRIPGYLNVKGPNSDPTRPHRMVKQLNVASGSASREMLEEIRSRRTSTALDKPAPATSPMPEDETPEDEIGKFTLDNVEKMLAGISERESDFQFEAGKTTSYGPGFHVSCPNADEHSVPDGAIIDDSLSSTAVVWVNERGWANFRCQHAHCQDLGWHEFVELTKSADLQRKITEQPTYVWPNNPARSANGMLDLRSQRGALMLFSNQNEYFIFKGRVEETPAWEFAAEWPDRDDISTFHWPEYETWVKTVATTAATAQGEFKFPKIPGKVEDYLLLPRFHDFDGWAGRGRTHIIAGSSGSGKTTLMAPLLLEQWQGKTIFGHVGARLRPLVIFADRGELSNEETLRRLGLSNSSLPICHLSDAVDDLAIYEILKIIEGQTPLPEVVYIEGADELVSKPLEGAMVSRFMNGLKKISGHYHISFILSVGAPKSKPKDQHALIRDRVFGSEKWVRKSDMVLSMMAVGDGTGKELTLTVQYRNAPAEKFELEFKNGRVVEKEFSESGLEPDPLEMWAIKREKEEGKKWFTRPDAVTGLAEYAGMGRSTVCNKIFKLLVAKKLVSRPLKNPTKNLTEEFRLIARPHAEKQAPVTSNIQTTKD